MLTFLSISTMLLYLKNFNISDESTTDTELSAMANPAHMGSS